jgi:hypothetical protein
MKSKKDKILSNWHRSTWWTEEALPYLSKEARRAPYRNLSQILYKPPESPVQLMDEDWDNVIILDACRYDLFEQTHTLTGGDLEFRISPGSATPEFLQRNFEDQRYLDTVYVTANPMYQTKGLEDVFYKVVDVWDDHWDDELKTVIPESMVDPTIKAQEDHPNKRIISHFMQPHYPFIGEIANELGRQGGFELTYKRATGKDASRDDPTVWERLKHGEVSREQVWDAYRENLEITFPHVKSLLRQLDGKSVVTSDHGNLVGEKIFRFGTKLYGHPVGFRCEQLNKVPWMIFESDDRRKITEAESVTRSSSTSEKVSERLADLGYVDI